MLHFLICYFHWQLSINYILNTFAIDSSQTNISYNKSMEEAPQLKHLILTDIEKNIDIKIITQYLTATKAIDHISRFTKKNDRFLLQFTTQQQAEQFMQQRAFIDKIIKKKLNLYFAFFQDQNGQFQTYELYGVKQQMWRRVFEICSEYGLCRINILQKKAVVSLWNNKKEYQGKEGIVEQKLKQMGIRWIKIQQSSQSFACSIELINYQRIQSIQLTKTQISTYQNSLKAFMMKVSQKQIRNIQVKSFMHKETIPMLKAYFKYNNNNDTFQVFEQLRLYLITFPPQVQTRLFYYSKESNTFQTLFTTGLQMPSQMTHKQFENRLIEDFRKINPNVIQILLKQCGGKIWTGKIYMRDEESGKQLASEYQRRRNFIYMHYKDKNKIVINIFQDKKTISQIRKIENNADKMLEHIRDTHQREKQAVTPFLRPSHNHYKKESYQPREYRARGYNQSNKQPHEKQQKRIKYKPKQQDFPSI